jgi:hypothetical protein
MIALQLSTAGIVGSLGHPQQTAAFLPRRPAAWRLFDWSTLIECALGVDVTNEVNIGRKIREDTLAAVSAVDGEYNLVVGEPFSCQPDEFAGKFGSSPMVGISF